MSLETLSTTDVLKELPEPTQRQVMEASEQALKKDHQRVDQAIGDAAKSLPVLGRLAVKLSFKQ